MEYDKACLNILLDTNYYKELNENPNTSYKETFMEEIQNLLHKKLRTKNDFYNLLDGTQIPSFYAKPKTHKTYPDIPTFRYICNFHGCLIPTSKYRSERRN